MGAESESQVANNIAFQAMGKAYKASANTVSQSFQVTADSPCNQVMVVNHSNPQSGQPVYFTFGNSSVTVAAPTGSGANASYAMVSIPNSVITITVPKQFTPTDGLYVAYITETLTGECYFIPGEGL